MGGAVERIHRFRTGQSPGDFRFDGLEEAGKNPIAFFRTLLDLLRSRAMSGAGIVNIPDAAPQKVRKSRSAKTLTAAK